MTISVNIFNIHFISLKYSTNPFYIFLNFNQVYLNSRKRNLGFCIICYGNQIKILIKPCNHLVTCVECASKIGCCPVCRASIISTEILEYI